MGDIAKSTVGLKVLTTSLWAVQSDVPAIGLEHSVRRLRRQLDAAVDLGSTVIRCGEGKVTCDCPLRR